VGVDAPGTLRHLYFTYGKTDKIYFPYSIEPFKNQGIINYGYVTGDKNLKYIISSSVTYALYDSRIPEAIFVVPYASYYDIIQQRRGSGYIMRCRLNDEDKERFIPANIAFFFNYEENPNEGYFFVDLLEESGKITKPPYDPKREGYTFDGWYKEPECLNKWDFDTDEVTITFDEEGNRIYEEIKLYAKWTSQK
jgi:uncharacterized repeat protein (TIGR02543 family)